MDFKVIVAGFAVLGLAGPAFAGPRIVTPPVDPGPGGSVRWIVANASPTKSGEYVRTIYEYDGTAALTPGSFTLGPNMNIASPARSVAQGHCVIEVVKGGKRNVRVLLEAKDSGGNLVAVVAGQ